MPKWKIICCSANSKGTKLEQVAHTRGWNIVPERLAERVWSPGGTQKSFIREGYAPKTNPLPFLGRGSYPLTLRRTPLSKRLQLVLTVTKQAETYPVSDDPLSGSALQRSRRNHQFCVNRSPIRYAELYSVGSHALGCGERELGCNYKNLMLKVSLRERQIGYPEHVFTVFVMSLVHFRFYRLVMSYNYET